MTGNEQKCLKPYSSLLLPVLTVNVLSQRMEAWLLGCKLLPWQPDFTSSTLVMCWNGGVFVAQSVIYTSLHVSNRDVASLLMDYLS